MRFRAPSDAIPVRQIEARPADPYREFILAGLLLAALAGFLLGLHIPMGRLFDWSSEARRPDIIQVHGQVQLLGFAGLFVLGMSLRIMPRFSGAPLRLGGLIPLVWGLLVGGLATRAFVQLWLPDEARDYLAVATSFAILLAAWAYLLIAVGTLTVERQPQDGTSWFFMTGAFFFFAQAALGAFLAIDEAGQETRVLAYLPNTAMLHMQIFGFIMAFVGGVGTRAFPSMMGRERPDAGARRAALLLVFSVLLLALPLVWAEYGGYSDFKVRLSALGLLTTGLLMMEIARLTGVLTPAANRVARASRAQFRLVRSAMVWLVAGGLYAAYLGARSLIEGDIPAFYSLDALRHVFALGVITTLILGVSMLILPEFAGERAGPHWQDQMSAVLLVVLTVVVLLRAGSAVFATDLDEDVRNVAMSIAGILIEAAVLVFLYRFFILGRRLHRHA